tara:strand:- start:62 stop:661 length:600 start_codon:yes stop_codon:yes gene_type:complete
MAFPIVAAGIVVKYIAKKGIQAAIKKYGNRQVKNAMRKKADDAATSVSNAANKKKTVGVRVPGAKKIADSKKIPVSVKKNILGTEGRLSVKPTRGERIAAKRNKNSRLEGQTLIKMAGSAVGGGAAALKIKKDIEGIKKEVARLKKERTKEKDKRAKLMLTAKIDNKLLKAAKQKEKLAKQNRPMGFAKVANNKKKNKK